MSFQLHRNGQYIPCDLPKLREMARKGELAQDEYVFDERVRQWVGAAQIAEMKDAWSIGENEATVAMELTPEMLAMFEGNQEAAKPTPAPVTAQRSAPTPGHRVSEPAPRPEPRPEPMREVVPESRSIPPSPEPARGNQDRPGFGGGMGGSARKSNRPTGEIADPTMTTIKNVICFVFAILWLIKRYDEVNAFFGEKRFTWWHLLIPVWGIIVMWKFFNSISEMAQLVGANVPNRAAIYLVGQLCTGGLLTFYLMQTDLNAIWEHMGARPAK
jgi:hypothetical protein